MIIIDTSVIVAYMNRADDHHDGVSRWLDQITDDLSTTPLIIAEVDHLLGTRAGRSARAALHGDLAAGAYLVDWWDGATAATVRIAEEYSDMDLGLADSSLVALAARHATLEIATLDERHFRALRPLAHGDSFRLLPADT